MSPSFEEDYDIVIIGGGLVGLSCAYLLRNSSLKIAIIEAAPARVVDLNDPSARSIALSYASQKIFQHAQLWPALTPYATPIKTIHISDRGHFGFTELNASDMQLDAMGYSIQAQAIQKNLLAGLQNHSTITFLQPAKVTHIDSDQGKITCEINNSNITLNSKLILMASGNSQTVNQLLQVTYQQKDYHQTALVCQVTLSRPHQHKAYERFTTDGPIALLPVGERQMAVVLTSTPEKIAELLVLDNTDFLKALQKSFGFRAGYFIACQPRSSYPLQLSVCDQMAKGKVLILGNAAHTLHPVAAQGFNLALRNVQRLTEYLLQGNMAQAIAAYETDHVKDKQSTAWFTDTLITVFSNSQFPFTPLRSLALASLNNIKPLKNYIAKKAMGYFF